MAAVTLKSLHNYLRMLENASDLKRRMPSSPNPRTMKEALYEISRLVGIDFALFKEPQTIAALIGAQRFVMIGGEPSVIDHIARLFDSSRVLLTVLIDPAHFEKGTPAQMGPTSGTGQTPSATKAAQLNAAAQTQNGTPFISAVPRPEPETPLDTLMPLLSGNLALTCMLFRALFEHMLGFVSPGNAQQGNVILVSELTGSREHSRSFLATALFILGAEVDGEHLMSFMMPLGLFGMPIFENMLRNRDYCDAFLGFRRLERAFMGPPAAEEAQLRNRLDQFNAQFAGEACGANVFEDGEPDRARVDAHLAATDLLEALAFTPWRICLGKAIALASSHSLRSVATIARQFERLGQGEATREQVNREIADHLLAFARQFSADPSTGPASHAGPKA
jgi:hypothetical protein